MKIELSLILIALVLYSRSEDYEVQDYIMKDNIIILHPRIFHDVVDQFPNGLLVKFFSPYCPKSAEFRVQYIELAQRIKENELDVAVAELDGNDYQDICDEYKVQGFPTVLLFKNGNYLEYQGVRTEDKIYQWVVKKINYKMKGFNDLQSLNKFIKTQSSTALYYGDQTNPKFKTFMSACQNLDEVTCVYVQSQEIAAQFSLEPNNIIIFKNYGQDKEFYKGSWDESDLWSWCQFKSVIAMTQCDQYIISNIFIYGFPAIVLLRNKEDSNSLEILRSAAPKVQNYAIITYSNFDDEWGQTFGQLLNISQEEDPQVWIVQLKSDLNEYDKWQMEGNLTSQNIVSFAQKTLGKKLKIVQKSQEEPINSHFRFIRILVGSNFNNVVFEKEKDVFVYLYDKKCKSCPEISKHIQVLANRVSNIETLVIAQMDLTENSVDFLVQYVPTLLFFPANKKDKVLEYKGELIHERMVQWLIKKVTHSFNYKDTKFKQTDYAQEPEDILDGDEIKIKDEI